MNERTYGYNDLVDENFLLQMEKHKQQEMELLKLTQQKTPPQPSQPHQQNHQQNTKKYPMQPPPSQFPQPTAFEFTPYHQMTPNRNFSIESQNFDTPPNNYAQRYPPQFSPQFSPQYSPQMAQMPQIIPQMPPQIPQLPQTQQMPQIHQHQQHQIQQNRKRQEPNGSNNNMPPSMDIQPSSPFFLKYQNDSYTLDSDCALHLTKKVLDDMNILLRFIQSSDSPILQTCSSHLLTAKHNVTKFTTTVANINSTDKISYLSNELSNSKVEDYTFLDILGTGTFGIARLCNYVPLNEYLCVKILNKEKVVRLKQVEHVLSEKYILSNCRHPFIVHLFKTFQDEQNLYFIMEYVSGGELFSAIKKRGGLHVDAARIYAAEIILVIEYLHLNHIIHRDLKPENLLIDKTGHLKLTDFGFAKYLVDKTWTTCGTPEYIAPEIILSKGHNKGVDWWSLGILLYEMLVGQPPFQGDEEYSVFERILELDYTIPSHVDPVAADLISQLLVVDTTQRLGCMIGGVSDVKNHPFFDGVNWNALLLKMELGPIHPRIMKENDTSNFFIDNDEVYRSVSTGMSPFNDDIFKDF